jgi:hypothetical protein
MKNLQRWGGAAALVSAASYLFAIGLYLALMLPLADPELPIGGYVAFYAAHRTVAYWWSFAMYIVHGLSLAVLVPALYERLKPAAPRLALVAAGFGAVWTAFVLLSGFITIWGNEALLGLYARSPDQAQAFKIALTTITLGIDSSDRCLGALWLGLAGLAAWRTKAFPRAVNGFGIALGAAVLVLGLVLPATDSTASFVFGMGAIVWWTAAGIRMLARPAIAAA